MSNKHKLPWESGLFHHSDQDQDPLSGFANIMDVMLVFALGLIVALISQSKELQQHFSVEELTGGVAIEKGKELIDVPPQIQQQLSSGKSGMESVGTVYRDPQTGKLILVGQ